MALNTSRLAYEDCFIILDRAVDSPKGIRLKFANSGTAKRFRTRLHYARKIDREDNQDNFEADHPMCGRSIYDQLTVREPVPDGKGVWLHIEKLGKTIFEIEELTDGEQEFVNGDRREVQGEDEGKEAEEAPAPEANPPGLRRI